MPRPDDEFGDEQDPPMGRADLLLFVVAVASTYAAIGALCFALRPLLPT